MSETTLTEAVYYILLSLVRQPNHGYGIIKDVELISSGRFRLVSGTLYGALSTLQRKKWIVPLSVKANSRQKKYMITELGKNALISEIQRFKELVADGCNIINETPLP